MTTPFLGGIVDMVKDPHAFWEKQRAYAFPGLSWNSIVTKFTVMVTDPATIRHVFNHNRWARAAGGAARAAHAAGGRRLARRGAARGRCGGVWGCEAPAGSLPVPNPPITLPPPPTPQPTPPFAARTPSCSTSTPTLR
jgi:hypothetical protein